MTNKSPLFRDTTGLPIRPFINYHIFLFVKTHLMACLCSSSGRAGSSVASVPRTPPFPGSNARTRDRMQALQAYYQQSSAQSHQPDSPIVSRGPVFPSGRRPARGIASGMGSTSSSSDQAGGSGFIRFNIWERDPYMQSQQAYSVNQMDREPNIWTSSFNEGSGSFHQRHGGGGGSS